MPARVTKNKQLVEAKNGRQPDRFKSNLASYSASTSQTIEIEVATNGKMIDFRNHALLFNMSGAATGETTLAKFNDFAASTWMKEIRFYAGNNQIGKSLKRYNGYARLQFDMKSNNESDSSYLETFEGAKSFAETGQTTVITSRQYAHHFLSGIPTVQDYFANNKVDALRIEIDMENADNVISYTDASARDYTIDSIYFLCDLITLTKESMEELNRRVSAGGIKNHYTEYHSYIDTAISGDSVINVGILDGAMKNSQAFMVLDSYRTISADYWAQSVQNNLSSYRWRLGQHNLTKYEIKVSATKLAEYLYYHTVSQKMNFGLSGFAAGNERLDFSTRFVLGQRADLSHAENVISSMVDGTRNKLVLDVNFSSSPASHSFYVYTQLDKEFVIKSGRETVNTVTDQITKQMNN